MICPKCACEVNYQEIILALEDQYQRQSKEIDKRFKLLEEQARKLEVLPETPKTLPKPQRPPIKTLDELLALTTLPPENYSDLEWKDGADMTYDSVVRRATPGVNWFFEKYEGDYQGDCYMVGEKDGYWLFFHHSYGSCSHCDLLSDDVKEAFESVLDSISVFDSSEEVLVHISKFDWLERFRPKDQESFESEMIKELKTSIKQIKLANHKS